METTRKHQPPYTFSGVASPARLGLLSNFLQRDLATSTVVFPLLADGVQPPVPWHVSQWQLPGPWHMRQEGLPQVRLQAPQARGPLLWQEGRGKAGMRWCLHQGTGAEERGTLAVLDFSTEECLLGVWEIWLLFLVIVKGHFWRPFSWEPGALTKCSPCLFLWLTCSWHEPSCLFFNFYFCFCAHLVSFYGLLVHDMSHLVCFLIFISVSVLTLSLFMAYLFMTWAILFVF